MCLLFIGRYLTWKYIVEKGHMNNSILLYEYRDLFIDMDVCNNRSELAIANRHQER